MEKRKVAIADLQLNLFVRKALNQDHALYLASLIENGVKLPPIKITRQNIVIDGRHRIEAHDVLGLKEIEAEIVDIKDETDIIAEAYKANVGGPLPPSSHDTEHAVMLLLDRCENKKRIGELLGLPPALARRYISDVQSRMARAKIQRAAAAVTDGGLTVAKAAEQHGVDIEKLKEVLSGNRRKAKQGIAEMQRTTTSAYKSLGSKVANVIKRLLEKYEDGDVTAKQVREIFVRIEQSQKRASRSLSDWKSRFEAMNKS